MAHTIILFGASGFVGRNLLARLTEAGHRVHAVSRSGATLPGAQSTTAIHQLGDVPDVPNDSIVINVAAHRYDAKNFLSGQSDILWYNSQLAGRVYDFCVARGLKEVRAASSVAVYSADQDVLDDAEAIDLNAAPHEREAFYAWSKRWGEIIAGLYRDRYEINTISFRLSNPYGPYDSLDVSRAHVLPAFVLKALSQAPEFEILGNPEVSRDFIYVGDVCDVFLSSLNWRGTTEAYNLCTGEQTRLIDLAETIMNVSGLAKPIKTAEDVTKGVAKRVSTASRVMSAFKIDRFTSLEEGLKPTIGWYRDALDR